MVEEIKQDIKEVKEEPQEPTLSKQELKKQKKAEKREARFAKIRKRFFKDDIKYQGPLSYRYLRVLGWVVFILGQIALLNALTSNFGWDPLGSTTQTIFSYASSLMTPLFIIASFGMVLSGTRGYRNFIILYGAAFLAIGIGIIFFYYRYINGLFVKMGLEEASVTTLLTSFLRDRIQINVFADLFAFTTFHYFVNYTPKKLFQGKKIYIFRLFALIPLIYALASYILKAVYILGDGANLPFFLFPFMTTKSPLVFGIFVTVSLWIKNREKIFIKIGSDKEHFAKFLNSKRNSLSFSVTLSIIIGVFAILEILMAGVLTTIYIIFKGEDFSLFDKCLDAFGIGQVITCLIAVPFILLYSYTRDHKDTNIDLFIPIAGIGLTAFVYVEYIYNFLIHIVGD